MDIVGALKALGKKLDKLAELAEERNKQLATLLSLHIPAGSQELMCHDSEVTIEHKECKYYDDTGGECQKKSAGEFTEWTCSKGKKK